jgi:diguanylate cyclase (GGDEF)-like protein
MIDVDQFKPYNDTFGHPAGDAALRTLAQILQNNARDHDVVARYGGEEFALILPGTDGRGARRVCERLRGRIADRHWPLRPVTASFGVASLTPATLNGAQLLDEADRALYMSKRHCRNCVTHFDESVALAV